ncbi:subtilisin-like protease [Phlyctema vagabunda]|uniref:Subtilisin-like protease n=1 Tax=Phlyctema vagabunda TaxID=108571 RepID=A0ABR4P2H1_9HELO
MFSNPIHVLLSIFAFLVVLAAAAPAPSPHSRNRRPQTTTTTTTAVNGIGIPVSNPDAENQIANRYIVVYYNNASDVDVQSYQSTVATALKKRSASVRKRDGSAMSSTMQAFSMGGWRAMALDAEDDMILEIAASQMVNYVEADTMVKASTLVQQTNAPPGLDRISSAKAGATSYVFDDSAGAGITAYIVDTGIRTTHTEFEGRAIWGTNTVNTVMTDENGHGSHVAGTVGGATFGVAKSVELVAVKVLDADGAGSNSGVIAGVNFVATNATARGLSGKAVMNMSLGGSKSAALNSAVAGLTRAGVLPIVAAGNENQDALNTSPGSAPSAITVGAIDAKDTRASFSNFGTAVDIFAPGVDVLSVGIASNTDTATLSGTSMASPHVCGLAAYLMALDTSLTTPAAVTEKMLSLAAASGATALRTGTGTTTLIANNGSGQ